MDDPDVGRDRALAALVLALGFIWAVILGVGAWRRSGQGRRGCAMLRQSFGGLFALEILGRGGPDPGRNLSAEPGGQAN